MADFDLAAIGAVSTSYTAPRVAIIKGTESSTLVIPAANIGVKFNSLTVGEDPGGTDPNHEITSDPKLSSYPNDPLGAAANLVLERYYYGRLIPPQPPYRSTISVLESNLSAAAMQAAIDATANLTDWGSGGGVPARAVVNLYGVVRLGDYVFAASQDYPRVTKILASSKSVVGAVDYTPQVGPNGYIQSLILANGKLLALINEAAAPWGANPGYQPSVVVEVVPGVGGAAPSFNYSNMQVVTETIGQATYSLLNAAKLAYNGGANLYVAGIGGSQKYGQSNGAASTLFRIPISPAGVLGAPQVAYYGNTSGDLPYDIRDIDVSEDTAVILVGGYESDSMTFTYVLLRQPLADTVDPSDPSVTITGLDNTHEADIVNLFYEYWSLVNFDYAIGGAYHNVKHERSFKHFWCGHSVRLAIYDDSAVADLADYPSPRTLSPTDFYGGAEGYLNSVELFTDNAAHAAPSPLRSAAHSAAGHGASASAMAHREGRNALDRLRAAIEKRKPRPKGKK